MIKEKIHKPIEWAYNSPMKKLQDDLGKYFMRSWRKQGMDDKDILEHLQKVSNEFFKK